VDDLGTLEPSDFAPRPPAAPDRPATGEVHLWTILLDPPPARVAAARRRLADDERARADRFRFDRHRRRFTVGRAALRELLAGYLGFAPEAVRFAYGEKGKPSLDRPTEGSRGALHFNLSNSHELALAAVAVGVEVGVDVEWLRPMPDGLRIAERYFSAAERAALAALPEDERDAAFFNGWTRKEAYLKAIGDGLTVPLDRFDVTLAPGAPTRILALAGDAAAAARWSLLPLRPAAGYVGALALPAPGPWRLHGWQWAG
jgi:4'-phosphopantetheinyl transferase